MWTSLVRNYRLFWKPLILADGYMWTLNSPLLHCSHMRWGPNFVIMVTQFLVKWGLGTLASGNGDLKSVCLQNWSKWLNLLIKGESFVCFINGDPCGYSGLFLFSVHTTPREFSQFEITKNAQNISLRPQPWTWGGDSFWQGWKICSWRV